MAVYKPKKKTGTNTFEEIKIPASCIDGLPSGGGGKTYTFAEGTTNGAFQVTPSGETAQSVKVHGLNNAAYAGTTSNVTSSSNDLPTSAAVYSHVTGRLPVIATSVTSASENPVTSKGIYNFVTSKIPTVDSAMSSASTNPVQNKVIYTQLQSCVRTSSTEQSIAGTKNFTGTLQYGGTNVAKYFEYKKLSTAKTYTATASGTISIKTSDIVPSTDYVANATYEIYGQILAYSSSTGKVFLYSNKWGDNNSTDYYIINTTANARVGSTAFVIPCSGTLTCYKNINFSEFSLRIYGYRRISQ